MVVWQRESCHLDAWVSLASGRRHAYDEALARWAGLLGSTSGPRAQIPYEMAHGCRELMEGRLADADLRAGRIFVALGEADPSDREKLLQTAGSFFFWLASERTALSNVERARINVTRTIRAAIGVIARHAPLVADDLDRQIETGRICRYQPDVFAPIEFLLDSKKA